MNRKTRTASALVLTVLIMICSAVPAFAAAYTSVKGDNAHGFRQFLVIDKNARVPSVEFGYSIVPGQAAEASEGKAAVLAGVGSPSVGKAVFTEGEAASTAQTEGVTITADEQYAVKTVNFDFSGVSFTEPGIYRYVVTMTSADQQAVEYDIQKGSQAESKKRILDVYVIDQDGVLKVDSYAFHETASSVSAGPEGGSADVTVAHARLADKSDGFVNRYVSCDLEFGKEITGNQGARDKYFEFTLNITGAAENASYAVDISAAEAASGSTDATIAANRGKDNPVQINTDASGAASVKYYLCDGQYITVKGLPKGASYSLTENKEDYVSAEGISAELGRGGKAYEDPLSGTLGSADIGTGFTNTRNGVVPTGLISMALPGTAAAGLGAVGLFALAAGRKHRDEEDD